jgi:hypothetical protein
MHIQSPLWNSAVVSSSVGTTVILLSYEVLQFDTYKEEMLPIRLLKAYLVMLPLTLGLTIFLALLGWCFMYWRSKAKAEKDVLLSAAVRLLVLLFGAGGAAFGYWIGAGNVTVATIWFFGASSSIVVFSRLNLGRYP